MPSPAGPDPSTPSGDSCLGSPTGAKNPRVQELASRSHLLQTLALYCSLFVFIQKAKQVKQTRKFNLDRGRELMFLFCYTRVSLGQKISLDFHSSSWSTLWRCVKLHGWMEGLKNAICSSRWGGERAWGWKGARWWGGERGQESKTQRRNGTENLRYTKT